MASKHSPRLLLVWTTLAVAAGCGQIIGLSDYQVDPALDAAGGDNASGNAGKGGSKPSAGTGGMPNAGEGGTPAMHHAGAGGEPPAPGGASGTGATAGASGEAGAGGAAPVAKFMGCDGTAFKGSDAILRSCILRVSCMIWAYPNDSISRCLSQDAQNTYEGTKCTLDATSCDDITACEGEHIENTFCTGKAAGTYCNTLTNELVTCGDYPFAKQCDKYNGGTCKDFGVELSTSTDTAACALPANAVSCAATTDTAACSNGYDYLCQGNVAYGTKCSNFAASCDVIGGAAGCYYPLNTCTTEGVTCANDRATWCDGSTKAVFDCGAVGLSCATQGDYYTDGGHQCTAPGCTQDDLDTCEESCVNGTSKINLCYGGSKLTVDCKDYGFKKCGEYDYTCTDFSMGDCMKATDTIHYADCEN